MTAATLPAPNEAPTVAGETFHALCLECDQRAVCGHRPKGVRSFDPPAALQCVVCLAMLDGDPWAACPSCRGRS